MEVEVAVGRVDRIDPANSEIEVGGKDRALQGDTVTDFPVVPPRQIGVDYAACAIFFPRRQLFGRHDLVGGNIEVLVGIGGELGKKVDWFVVNILAPEPGHRDDVHDSGNGADL